MISDVERVLDRYFNRNQSARLSTAAFTVLVTLARFNESQLSMSQLSIRKIMHYSGILSNKTVVRALKELKEKGYLTPLYSYAKTYRPQVYLLLPESKNPDIKEKEERKDKTEMESYLESFGHPSNIPPEVLEKEVDKLLDKLEKML